MTRHLALPLISGLRKDSPLHLIGNELDKLPRQPIDIAPWSGPSEKPAVSFSMGHSRDCLYLKYYVKERNVQAKYRKTNGPVYKDSCVEFFIAFRGEREYYNLEFNCLGTCHIAFGPDRNNRKLLPQSVISRIKHAALLRAGNGESPYKTWHLTLAIPVEVFAEHTITSLDVETAKVNFYKCGDELAEPHFLTWNMIDAPNPDFHLPRFFGDMKFLKAGHES